MPKVEFLHVDQKLFWATQPATAGSGDIWHFLVKNFSENCQKLHKEIMIIQMALANSTLILKSLLLIYFNSIDTNGHGLM